MVNGLIQQRSICNSLNSKKTNLVTINTEKGRDKIENNL